MDRKRIILLLFALFVCLTVPARALDDSAVHTGNWYEIFVRSFQDSNGDGIGDLQGVIDRLDYIGDMGYNGIWLMPVMPSPSYHKYDVTDYLNIDPEYGSLADMKRLVTEAHSRGIRIIIDLVLNHSSLYHPWFTAAASALEQGYDSSFTAYYNFQRDPGTNRVQLGESGWYYEEQFAGGGMPDLNLDDPDVRTQISLIMEFWLKTMDVDGFRLDAVTSYYSGKAERNIEFLNWVKAEAERLKPGSYLVAECWEGLTTIARYYESDVDSFFLFPGSQAEGFIAQSLRGRSKRAEKFADRYQAVLDAIPGGLLAPFLSNHDTGRTIGSIQGRQNLPIAKFAEGVLNMMTGNVFTYYGEEAGMVGSGADPNKRLAMYWNDGDMTEQPPGTTAIEYAYPSVDEQLADPDSLLNYCRKLNHARLVYTMIPYGENGFVYTNDDILLMRRTLDGESCLIAMNFSPKEAGECPVPEGAAIGTDIETGAESAVLSAGTLTLPPYAIVILTE